MRRLIVAVILLILNGPLGAENGLVVISSAHSTIKKGAIIKSTQTIELQSGESLKLLSSTGGIIQVQGPYSGAIAFESKASDGSVLKSVSELVKNSKSTDFTLAIFRNSSVTTPTYRPDIWGIDIRKSGKYCLRPNLPIYLWWPQALPGDLITLTDTTNSQSIELEWPEWKKYTAWPEILSVDDRVIYSVRNTEVALFTEFKIQLLPTDLKDDMEQIAWMSDHDCKKQAIRLLGTIVNESQ
jgi:hypothetical protein